MAAETQERQPGRERLMDRKPAFAPRYPGANRLAGKVALVTGGDSGIGRAVSILFAREGARVAFTYLEEAADAEETERLCAEEGAEAIRLRADLSEHEACRSVVEETLRRFGRLDVLVNNAAEQHPSEDFEALPPDQIEATFRTNIFGYIYLAQAALPHMGAGASIVNTTSVTAYRGSHHLVDYSATKGAIVAFTRSLAKNVADRGIRVNAVAPGPIWTPLIPATFDEEKVASFGTNTPLGRPGEPNEVAPCHLFLACADSSYMTGQVLHVNGGEVVGG